MPLIGGINLKEQYQILNPAASQESQEKIDEMFSGKMDMPDGIRSFGKAAINIGEALTAHVSYLMGACRHKEEYAAQHPEQTEKTQEYYDFIFQETPKADNGEFDLSECVLKYSKGMFLNNTDKEYSYKDAFCNLVKAPIDAYNYYNSGEYDKAEKTFEELGNSVRLLSHFLILKQRMPQF